MKTSTARRTAMLFAGLIAAAALTSGTASAAPEARNPCGLYRDGDQAMYKNCTTANENIFVTRIFGENLYHCVTPGSVKHVGPWNDVFRAYNRGTC
ncbi:DUF6355 family natural product biosynthesis protein [Nonomuraea sp. NBC_01738]|uniref:DUF6355 family natural product biosynthesis protein n=1 Tax=Nonomuraea sp. NBC_01738 TaxID=2976003 RepID=UPI002E147EAC|nr:DUF6355 family natural product biosynthesis protein [Nonomuraea sp. NBC_01738]